ncbi:MAG: LptA/OstA family protein [Pseudomonadota bacterium]
MANSCRSWLVAALFVAAPAYAQQPSARLPISLDADSSVFDRSQDRIEFTGLRITQGAIGIEAERGVTRLGRDTKLDFSDSTWEFHGNVRIDIETATIVSDSAELYFSDHTLQHATIQGSPATFDDSRGPDQPPLRAEASTFEYNLADYVIRFVGKARIAEGDNEVTGADLLYDLTGKRVNFKGDPQADERVRITIVPDTVDETVDDVTEDPIP